jgi:hypothetical protein
MAAPYFPRPSSAIHLPRCPLSVLPIILQQTESQAHLAVVECRHCQICRYNPVTKRPNSAALPTPPITAHPLQIAYHARLGLRDPRPVLFRRTRSTSGHFLDRSWRTSASSEVRVPFVPDRYEHPRITSPISPWFLLSPNHQQRSRRATLLPLGCRRTNKRAVLWTCILSKRVPRTRKVLQKVPKSQPPLRHVSLARPSHAGSRRGCLRYLFYGKICSNAPLHISLGHCSRFIHRCLVSLET